VHYLLSVRDTLGQPVSGYALALTTSPAGGALTGSQFDWNPGSQTGAFTARFRAEKPPLVLRRQARFTLTAGPISLAGARPDASVLRIGGRDFLLPPSVFSRDFHSLRLEFFEADGRTRRSLTGDLQIPAGARRTEYRLSGFSGVGLRAWLDGVPLRARP
jgi:hypothetical protein